MAMDMRETEFKFKAFKFKVDINGLTQPCQNEETNYKNKLIWIQEKDGVALAEKYLAESEAKLVKCYAEKVLPQLDKMAGKAN